MRKSTQRSSITPPARRRRRAHDRPKLRVRANKDVRPLGRIGGGEDGFFPDFAGLPEGPPSHPVPNPFESVSMP